MITQKMLQGRIKNADNAKNILDQLRAHITIQLCMRIQTRVYQMAILAIKRLLACLQVMRKIYEGAKIAVIASDEACTCTNTN